MNPAQHYIGVKQVAAWPEHKDGRPGYHVVYRHGRPDEYHSWSPAEEFERFYLPMGPGEDPTKINGDMVAAFVADQSTSTVGRKTTLAQVTLANGFELVDASSCVDEKNYSESVGGQICFDRIGGRIWNHLGFVLQWARNGLTPDTLARKADRRD